MSDSREPSETSAGAESVRTPLSGAEEAPGPTAGSVSLGVQRQMEIYQAGLARGEAPAAAGRGRP